MGFTKRFPYDEDEGKQLEIDDRTTSRNDAHLIDLMIRLELLESAGMQ